MEFKGTREILIDQGSVFKPLSGYVSVNLTNYEGWPVATVFAPDFEKLKADSLMLSKSPEMLEMLNKCILEFGRFKAEFGQGSKLESEIHKLIKEATEI